MSREKTAGLPHYAHPAHPSLLPYALCLFSFLTFSLSSPFLFPLSSTILPLPPSLHYPSSFPFPPLSFLSLFPCIISSPFFLSLSLSLFLLATNPLPLFPFLLHRSHFTHSPFSFPIPRSFRILFLPVSFSPFSRYPFYVIPYPSPPRWGFPLSLLFLFFQLFSFPSLSLFLFEW